VLLCRWQRRISYWRIERKEEMLSALRGKPVAGVFSVRWYQLIGNRNWSFLKFHRKWLSEALQLVVVDVAGSKHLASGHFLL